MKLSTTNITSPEMITIPDGKLAIIPLDGIKTLGEKIDKYIVEWRGERAKKNSTLGALGSAYAKDTYVVEAATPRFGSGEAKCTVNESVRGDDVYILVDVCNYSLTYNMNGSTNYKSPDDYFQDLKRVIAAVSGTARRINVIMPYLYEGRRMKRVGRESLDCANALQELERMGVNYIIAFDAHDVRVQNAIPYTGFEIFQTTYQFLKNVLRCEPELKLDSEHLMVISPDEGGMRRAIYLANVLGVDMGTFYQRHDYSSKTGSDNPVVATEYLGSDVSGKTMIVIDDMISSGHTVLQTARLLKKKGAAKIYICATFGMFTAGFEEFDAAYKEGIFAKVITTNLVYQTPELLNREYYISCDMSKFVALIIDTLNHDTSLSHLLDPVDRINRVIEKHKNHETI